MTHEPPAVVRQEFVEEVDRRRDLHTGAHESPGIHDCLDAGLHAIFAVQVAQPRLRVGPSGRRSASPGITVLEAKLVEEIHQGRAAHVWTKPIVTIAVQYPPQGVDRRLGELQAAGLSRNVLGLEGAAESFL